MDPDVIDIPWIARTILVRGLIIPRRKHASAELYQKIWTPEGSPLALHHRALAQAVAKELAPDFRVIEAMRYGNPSVRSALETLKKESITDITVLPLYPQYSLAATRSSELEVNRQAEQLGIPKPKVIGAFFKEPEFVDSFAAVIDRSLKARPWDHLMFSFHGLPERQVTNTDRSAQRNHCLRSANCCELACEANRDCYRHQCYETARLIARKLGLKTDQYTVAFQSRLTSRWIRPFSDELYESLPKSGVKRLAVTCPAFVADCLETLEEVAIRGKESFAEAGGEDLFLIPSLNSDPMWTHGVASLVRRLA